jgi:hypothetical protein
MPVTVLSSNAELQWMLIGATMGGAVDRWWSPMR